MNLITIDLGKEIYFRDILRDFIGFYPTISNFIS
jgi:hypothetical protein